MDTCASQATFGGGGVDTAPAGVEPEAAVTSAKQQRRQWLWRPRLGVDRACGELEARLQPTIDEGSNELNIVSYSG